MSPNLKVGIVEATTTTGIPRLVARNTPVLMRRVAGLSGDAQTARRATETVNPTPRPTPNAMPLVKSPTLDESVGGRQTREVTNTLSGTFLNSTLAQTQSSLASASSYAECRNQLDRTYGHGNNGCEQQT
jgi:hypothetical protein